jgi:hypothetical protein
MRYLILAYGDEQKCKALTEEQMRALGLRCARCDEELKRTGKVVGSGSLGWTAVSVRPRGGKPLVTDGSYIETREVVGGFIIVEASDLDEAVQLAQLHPAATLGEELGWGIEVRPFEQCALPKE